MTKELLNEWLTALRSGDYKQGKGYLNKDNEFCCLGVLCDILSLEITQGTQNVIQYDGSNAVLPKSVWEVQKFRNAVGTYDVNRDLATLNDNGACFDEIADIIEEKQDIIFTEVT